MKTECGEFICHELVSLRIGNLAGDREIWIEEVYITSNISVTTDHLMPVRWMDTWDHMADVVLERLPEEDASVGMIIGLNTSLNRHILDQRHGEKEATPSAYLTKLGWVVFGPTGDGSTSAPSVIHHIRPVEETIESVMMERSLDFWEKPALSTTENSYEDEMFLAKTAESCQFKNGKYWVNLPLRDEEPLPNNREMTLRCTASLMRKLEKDPSKRESYVSQVQKYIDRGYAELVPNEKLDREDGRVWYLSHHAVQHPTKQKIRVVFNPKT